LQAPAAVSSAAGVFFAGLRTGFLICQASVVAIGIKSHEMSTDHRKLSLKSSVKLALIAALLVEYVNLILFPFPIDVGLPENANWLEKAWEAEWVCLHAPGLFTVNWLDRVGLPDGFVIVHGGYLSTAILVFALAVSIQWINRRFAMRSPK
jgi:hypothetical protein